MSCVVVSFIAIKQNNLCDSGTQKILPRTEFSFVVLVQASDEDGDPVTYSITYGDRTGSFVIDRDKGVIKLIDKTKTNLIGPTYTLNISASDGYHVSEAIVVVGVQDVNNYSPVFTECDGYKPTVAEHSALGTTVFKVN